MKKTLLEILENTSEYLSGESIAQEMGMTRANVWKEINKLRQQGIEIDSQTNKGYRLSGYHHVYSPSYLRKNLPFVETISIQSTCPSTNDLAKQAIRESEAEWLIVVSDQQSQGKGRRGRQFYSPSQGIYLSIAIRPNLSLENVQLLTIAAALSVCDVLEDLFQLKPSIKWLNDVFVNHRKICGILCEGELELESYRYHSVVVGIGLNLVLDALPDELADIITAVNRESAAMVDRNQVVVDLVKQFRVYYQQLDAGDISWLERYRSLNFIIGQSIRLSNDSKHLYKAVSINDHGNLIVCDETGKMKTVNSEEVSLYDWKS